MKNAMNLKAVGLLVLFSLISLWTYAQSLTVKGVVKDSNGESIIGANVLEKGTTNGTITEPGRQLYTESVRERRHPAGVFRRVPLRGNARRWKNNL